MFELDGFIPCCHLFLSVTLFHEREERLWLQNFHQSLPFILHSAVASSFISHSMFKRLIHYVLFICRFIVCRFATDEDDYLPKEFLFDDIFNETFKPSYHEMQWISGE